MNIKQEKKLTSRLVCYFVAVALLNFFIPVSIIILVPKVTEFFKNIGMGDVDAVVRDFNILAGCCYAFILANVVFLTRHFLKSGRETSVFKNKRYCWWLLIWNLVMIVGFFGLNFHSSGCDKTYYCNPGPMNKASAAVMPPPEDK